MYPPHVTSSPTGPGQLLGGGGCGEPPGSRSSSPWKCRSPNHHQAPAPDVNEQHTCRSWGLLFKLGREDTLGELDRGSVRDRTMHVFYPLTETDWNPGELPFTQTPCCPNHIGPSLHDVTSSLHFGICVNKSPSGINSATTVSVLSFTPLQYIHIILYFIDRLEYYIKKTIKIPIK